MPTVSLIVDDIVVHQHILQYGQAAAGLAQGLQQLGGNTVEEVRKEIRLAMIAAMCNPDPAVQKRWREIPHTGDTITPEDLITYIAKQCLPQ